MERIPHCSKHRHKAMFQQDIARYNTMSGLLAEQRAASSSNFGRILLQLKYMREKHLLPASLTIGTFMEFVGDPPELRVKMALTKCRGRWGRLLNITCTSSLRQGRGVR